MTLVLRLWLILTAAAPFNSDEAVVGLMARHINQGARPLFFYGQSVLLENIADVLCSGKIGQ